MQVNFLLKWRLNEEQAKNVSRVMVAQYRLMFNRFIRNVLSTSTYHI